ncbi:WSC domain-containing protein ARB_07867-like isoform X1 [Branchiostoma floridae]|uniref:WSC domain-containing protein ARB_07867-like isoform X1 n=1 Tax=Branchiostoma floridae TaxID=7739 RepID=A0A9J7MKZ1_BRAFL|nr:WSC domain-containing protein ARB_07867-like isoform X1 [Branchiostoma floridae]
MARVLALVVVLGLVGAISAQSYKGCYKRKWGTFRTRDSSDDMTNEKCVEICAKEGLPYAGTYETKCGCGRESELTRLGDPTDESECASTCGGDVTQKCGKGNGLLTVWATGKEKREMNEVEDVKQDMRELEHHHHHHHDKKTADESHDKKAADEGHDKVATD